MVLRLFILRYNRLNSAIGHFIQIDEILWNSFDEFSSVLKEIQPLDDQGYISGRVK